MKTILVSPTYVHDPAFISALDAGGEWMFLPLRMSAWIAACKHLPQGKIVLPDDLFDYEARQSLYCDCINLRNELYPWLISSKSPKGVGYVDVALYFSLQSMVYARILEKKLKEKYLGCKVVYTGPYAEWALDHFTRIRMSFVEYACETNGTCGVRNIANRLFESVVQCAGCLLEKWPKLFMSLRHQYVPSSREADCWYVGLHEGDVSLRTEFLKRLKGVLRSRLGVLYKKDTLLVASPHELSSSADIHNSFKPGELLGLSRLPCAKWRMRWMGLLSSKSCRLSLAKKISEMGLLGYKDAYKLASIHIDPSSTHVCEYQGVASVLTKLGPKCLLTSGSCNAGAYVHEWALRNHVPVVQFPHGVYINLDMNTIWDADVVVTQGHYEAEYGRQHSKAETVISGLSFIQINMDNTARWRLPDNHERSALFLFSIEDGFLPDSYRELADDFVNMARAFNGHDWTLSLRGHPRYGADHLAGNIADYCASNNAQVHVNKQITSLFDDLRRSGMAVTRHWGGAQLQALCFGIPLVVWMPRSLPWETEADILNKLPLKAENASSLEKIVEQLRNPEACQRVIAAQDELVREFLGDPADIPGEEGTTALREVKEWIEGNV